MKKHSSLNSISITYLRKFVEDVLYFSLSLLLNVPGLSIDREQMCTSPGHKCISRLSIDLYPKKESHGNEWLYIRLLKIFICVGRNAFFSRLATNQQKATFVDLRPNFLLLECATPTSKGKRT